MSVENVYNCGKATFSTVITLDPTKYKSSESNYALEVLWMYVNKIKAALLAALYFYLSQLLPQILLETLVAETVIDCFMMLFEVIIVRFQDC